jgi:hypothetical protein
VIDPALWPSFGSAEAVNEALRAAVAMAKAVRPVVDALAQFQSEDPRRDIAL